MKKFIKRTTFFFILLICLFSVLWFCLYNFPNYYLSYSYSIITHLKDFIECDTQKNVVIIGDSRAMAGLAPKIIDSCQVYNLSVNGGTPITGYYTLKKLIKNQKQPNVIIVSYAPFHLVFDDTFPKPIAEDFFSFDEIRELYCEIYKDDIIFWDEVKLQYYNFKSINLANAYLRKLKFPLFFSAEVRKSMFARNSANETLKNKMVKNMGTFTYGTAEYCDKLNQETGYKYFEPHNLISKYLKNIFHLANENNIRVICVTAPMNEASNKSLTPEFRSGYNKYFRKLINEFPEVIFYCELISYENQYFGDASHLNYNGRLKFSGQLKNILNNVAKNQSSNYGKK